MAPQALAKQSNQLPTLFDDFFKPWNEWFDNGNLFRRPMSTPAVNVSEDENNYSITMAAPGLKKEDFVVSSEGNMLTISAEKAENKKEKKDRFTRKEYNYSSFSRSFTLPDDVNRDSIDARYENGELRLVLPKREEAKRVAASKQVPIK